MRRQARSHASRFSLPFAGTLGVAAAAALATYFFDPDQGRRRRAQVRDQVYGRLSHADDAVRVVALDVRNRLQGTVASLRRWIPGEAVSDEVLAERVRARLGRVVSHPGAIEVAAAGGVITLSGPVLAREHPALLRAVRRVGGVHQVLDRLELHEHAGNVSALQGGVPREERMDIAQEHWAPATRLAVGAAGAALALRGLARPSFAAPLLVVAGGALLVRAMTNMDLRRLAGARGHMGIDLTKTVTIAAPVDQVFALWRDCENFPKFMRNVRRVHRTAEDAWHWEVAGPLGRTVQWNVRITRIEPNRLISWSTTPDSSVQHAGSVRFQEEEGGTRAQVQMTYNPPAGALGHVVASLFGGDPKKELDEDLMRMKSLFETGKPARDAAQPQSSETGG